MTNSEKEETREEYSCPFCMMSEYAEFMMGKVARSRVGRHLFNAEKELLLAAREALDSCITKMEEQQEKKPRNVRKVKVD